MSVIHYTIIGPGLQRATQKAVSSGRELDLFQLYDKDNHLLRVGYSLRTKGSKLPPNPAITWFEAGEVEIIGAIEPDHELTPSRAEVQFTHPRQNERHLMVDLPLGPEKRIILRNVFRIRQNSSVDFVIQVEVKSLVGGKDAWQAAIRYDCAHGFIHRDQIAISGQKTKEEMPTQNAKDAVVLAFDEMRDNLVQWLGQLGYERLGASPFDQPRFSEDLENAKQTLLDLLDHPEKISSVGSHLVISGDDIELGAYRPFDKDSP